MKLEKAKRITKMKKSQLQNQKQVQNVIVNLPQATRKRKPKLPQAPKPQVQNKLQFQAPIYQPPVVSLNPKAPETNFVLSEILKHLNGTKEASGNQLEKSKPSEEQKALTQILQAQPLTLPQAFNTPIAPRRALSLAEEVRSDPQSNHPSFINPPILEATQVGFKFNPIFATPKRSKSLAQSVNVVEEKKFEPFSKQPKDQPWAELETGGHFGLLGINTQQLKDHKDAKREFTFEALSLPTLAEEPRPTSEEIDLGIVPPIAGVIVQEDRVETNEPPINLDPLSMGAGASFTKSLIKQPSSSSSSDDEFVDTSELRGIRDREVAKDTQEFLDYMKSLNLSSPTSRQGAELLTPTKEPSLAEKLNMPVAESRFASPEAPVALAEILVQQAKSKKVNSNTDSRLQVADFRNKSELIEAIKIWNREQPTKQITIRKADKKGDLTIDELEVEATANDTSFTDLKKNAQKKKGSKF